MEEEPLTERLKKDLDLKVRIYRSLIANLKDGAFLINLHGTILFVNNYMAHLLGYSQRDLSDRAIFDLMDKSAAEMEGAQKIKAHKAIDRFIPQDFIHRDGQRIHTLLKTIQIGTPPNKRMRR